MKIAGLSLLLFLGFVGACGFNSDRDSDVLAEDKAVPYADDILTKIKKDKDIDPEAVSVFLTRYYGPAVDSIVPNFTNSNEFRDLVAEKSLEKFDSLIKYINDKLNNKITLDQKRKLDEKASLDIYYDLVKKAQAASNKADRVENVTIMSISNIPTVLAMANQGMTLAQEAEDVGMVKAAKESRDRFIIVYEKTAEFAKNQAEEASKKAIEAAKEIENEPMIIPQIQVAEEAASSVESLLDKDKLGKSKQFASQAQEAVENAKKAHDAVLKAKEKNIKKAENIQKKLEEGLLNLKENINILKGDERESAIKNYKQVFGAVNSSYDALSQKITLLKKYGRDSEEFSKLLAEAKSVMEDAQKAVKEATEIREITPPDLQLEKMKEYKGNKITEAVAAYVNKFNELMKKYKINFSIEKSLFTNANSQFRKDDKKFKDEIGKIAAKLVDELRDKLVENDKIDFIADLSKWQLPKK